MKSIYEALKDGDMPERAVQVELARMMADFKETEVYKILALFNNNEIKDILTVGKSPDETAEHRLGRMEGIQGALENRVRLLIQEGKHAIEQKKALKKHKKSLEEDPDKNPDEE